MWSILENIKLFSWSTEFIKDTSKYPIWKFLSSIVKFCVLILVLLNPFTDNEPDASILLATKLPDRVSNFPVISTSPFTDNWTSSDIVLPPIDTLLKVYTISSFVIAQLFKLNISSLSWLVNLYSLL